MLKGKVHISTLALATLGLVDLISSMILFSIGMREANPFFGPLFNLSPLYFSIAKVIFLGGPILLLEYSRKHRPWSAEIGTWVAFVLYFYILVSHLLQLGM